jgi:hypothetical protein
MRIKHGPGQIQFKLVPIVNPERSSRSGRMFVEKEATNNKVEMHFLPVLMASTIKCCWKSKS